MNTEPLHAHSLAEISLYLMATPCPECGGGPLAGEVPKRVADEGAQGVVISTSCRECHCRQVLTFTLPLDGGDGRADEPYPVVNSSGEPSHILDVAQWITLFRVIIEAASKERDKMESRRLGLEAALCLEEAVKFYDDDNDVPPPSALFHDTSRARYQEHPEQFSRERLREMRGKLPKRIAMQKQVSRDAGGGRRAWWKFW